MIQTLLVVRVPPVSNFVHGEISQGDLSTTTTSSSHLVNNSNLYRQQPSSNEQVPIFFVVSFKSIIPTTF